MPSCCCRAASRCSPAAARRRTRSGRAAPQPFELMLDFFPNADHAPIYAAQASGYFKQAGLDVKIRQPADPSAPLKQVAAGRVDLAISYEPEVLRARDKGLHVVAVGALVRAAHVDHLAAEGRRSTAGGPEGQDGRHRRDRLPERLPPDDPDRRERDPRRGARAERRLQPRARRSLTGKVDAILGGFWNYEGDRPARSARSTRRSSGSSRRACPPTTSSSSWRTRTRSSREGPKIRRFIGALRRGARDAPARSSGRRDRAPAEGEPRPRSRSSSAHR